MIKLDFNKLAQQMRQAHNLGVSFALPSMTMKDLAFLSTLLIED